MIHELLPEPQFEGTTPAIQRITTGVLSLDIALGDRDDLGIVLRSSYELYGGEHSGKSTLALYLASQVRSEGKIAYLDLEYALDKEWALRTLSYNGFTGTLHAIDDIKKGELRYHAEMADEVVELFKSNEYNAYVLDSLGTWVPRLEAAADVGEAIVGRRAYEAGMWSRRMQGTMRNLEQGSLLMIVNHSLPKIGGRGHYTPGGMAKGYLANARMFMWRSNNKFDHGCFEATINIEKLRYGGKRQDQAGYVFIVPHLGVSKGMSALNDCIRYGLVGYSTGWIKLPGDSKNIGRIGEFVEHAFNGNNEPFEPFISLIEE